MALSGLDIYKLLPKTNCKKCGSPTCLAFAMKLAMKKASLDQCPDISEEAKKALDQASRPPIATIAIGTGDDKVEIGGETVLFRHEKTFYHQTAIAISVDDTLSDSDLTGKVKSIEEMSFERVGQHIVIDMIALFNTSNSAEKFVNALDKVISNSKKAIILISENPKAIEAALKKYPAQRPLIYAATSDNLKEMCELSKSHKAPLTLKADGLEELDKLSMEAASLGVGELILDPCPGTLNQALNDFTQIRRTSLKKNYRAFGYPVIAFVKDKDKYQIVRQACTFIAKYASLIVVDSLEREVLLPIITLRQNIYTDPQKPVTVEPKLYQFGSVDENSPFMVTTNFSLTFYTVAPEIEASKIPAYLLVTDSEGMSVLTAWAAEKFTPEIIYETMKKFDVEKAVSHKKMIIPGYVSVLSGKL
ncbi:MAG: acetyl-CoA decarbonylase/synthase complex subunit gamma, partial [Candidatus Omnitrophica bacterium]|nr:acetyl-CoA decarbonylase/synthase complex subunit gamma [Candidatus Omnitrophota bacterium]